LEGDLASTTGSKGSEGDLIKSTPALLYKGRRKKRGEGRGTLRLREI